MYRALLVFVIIIVLLAGCSKEVVEEEPVAEEPTPVQEEVQEDTLAIPEPEVVAPEPEPVLEDTLALAPAVSEVPDDSTAAGTETLEEKEGKLVEVLELISETDSVDVFYMVKPGDYLSLIALNEYGNLGMWRMIYKWNRKKIGDNPNLIYPFHEFLLKKPIDIAQDLEYELYDYTVKSNETLWSIAGDVYNNHYAWIVILRDNAAVLGPNIDEIPKGTILKLRSNLFN